MRRPAKGWLMMIIIGASSCALLPAAAATGEPPLVPTPEEAADARTRDVFGLSSNPAHVRSVRGASDRDPRLGIPLTPKEGDEMRRRDRVGLKLAGFSGKWKASEASRFGGAVQKAGTVIVWLQDATPAEMQQVIEDLGPEAKVEYRNPTHGLSQLRRDYDLVGEATAELNLKGARVQYSTLDIENNRVVVYVEPSSTGEALAEIKALGPSIEVQTSDVENSTDDVSRRTGDSRFYGGKLIVSETNMGCTASTSATSNGYYYIITAGHCGYPNRRWQVGDVSPYPSNVATSGIIGRSKNQYYQTDVTYCDCQVLGPIPASRATGAVITNNGATFDYTRTAAGYNEYYDYRPACVSAYQTAVDRTGGNLTCGYLGAEAQRVGEDRNVLIKGQIWWPNNGFYLGGGDSGAPVGDDVTFLGVHSGSNPDIFSRSYHVAAATGATPIFGTP